MLKTTGSSKIPALIFVGVNNNIVPREDGLKPYLSKSKKTKITKSKNLTKGPTILFNIVITKFLIFKAKVTFTQLRKAFTEALIFEYFDSEYYIQIETNASSYAIGEILSQLTSDQVISIFEILPKFQ